MGAIHSFRFVTYWSNGMWYDFCGLVDGGLTPREEII